MIERLAWPLRLAADGRLAVLEQDSPEEIEQCVRLVLRHRAGDRTDLPDLGIPDPVFAETIDAGAIENAVRLYEPRAPITATIDLDGLLQAEIDVAIESSTT